MYKAAILISILMLVIGVYGCSEDEDTNEPDSPTTPLIQSKDNIAWLMAQIVPNQIVPQPASGRSGLIISYQVPKTDQAYPFLFARSWIYDDFLAAIAFDITNETDSANTLLNALVAQIQADGKLGFSYNTNDAWFHEYYRTGAIALVGYGLCVHLKQTGANPALQAMAERIASYLLPLQDKRYGSFKGGPDVSMKKHIEELGENTSVLLDKTVEIVVKVGAVNGVPQGKKISVEKLRISSETGQTEKVWESEEYQSKAKTKAYLLYVDDTSENIPRLRINQTELEFESEDRMRLIALLAQQAKTDYKQQSGDEGRIKGIELGRRLWPKRLLIDSKWAEIPQPALRRVINNIVKWAKTHQITNRKDKTLVEVSPSYVRDTMLVDFIMDIKRIITDLVFNINKDVQKRQILPFHLIEGVPRRGYRLNTNPACIFVQD